jgi:uncharacterized protein
MESRLELNIPLDDFEYDELESFLLGLKHDHAVLNISEFDGFITAIASGPETVPPSEWLPIIWGGEEAGSVFESPDDQARITELIMRHLSATAATLLHEPDAFDPWFMENEVNGQIYLVVDDWCIGYMKAVMLRPNAWGLDDPAMVELMAPIPLFTSNEGWDLLEQLADRHIEYLQNEVLPAARALHEHWLGRRDALSPPEGARLH